jgi:DNA-directed RNA polymerase specialized sigma24 family protein
MSTNQPIAGPEELLAHAGFLGGLVRTLVFDQEQAEDYLQDTWAYALGKPPKSGPGLKTWLATAARNYIRQDRRSRDRRNRREARTPDIHMACRPPANGQSSTPAEPENDARTTAEQKTHATFRRTLAVTRLL